MSLAPRPTDDWPNALDHVAQDMKGAPLNVHKLMAHNPALLEAWWSFRNHSVQGGTLGNRLGEIVILRVSVHLGAWYEWASHVDRGLRVGLAPATILALLEPTLPADWPEAERLTAHAVDELMTLRALRTETRAALEQHLDTEQIMDIMAISGMYVILGCMIATWDLELDAGIQGRIGHVTDPAHFAEAAQRFAALPGEP